MNRKLIILVVGVVAIVAILAVFVVPLLLGGFNPPVDVYAKPTPLISESPSDLLPLEVAGFFLLDISGQKFGDGSAIATGDYEGGIQIQIARHASVGDASASIDAGISFWEDRSSSMTSVSAGEQHWFAAVGGGTTVFGWQKGVWVFLVFAPNEALRNQVAGELPF